MIAKVLVAIVGVSDVLAGAALLLAPQWFFDNIGTFPPYSRHYLGDAGAFLLPVGIALLVAATNPRRHYSLVLVGLGVSVLHFLAHLYGSVRFNESWLQTVEVGIIALGIAVAAGIARPEPA